MKFYNEMEQSWRKLKQNRPEVAKAIEESDEREYLGHGGWKSASQTTPCDDLVYRAPIQTEAEKFLEKWKGKKITVANVWDEDRYFIPNSNDGENVIGINNYDKPDYIDIFGLGWQLWESPKPKGKLDARKVAGWWCTWGSKKESVMVNIVHNNGKSLVTPAGIHWSIEQIEADKSITFSQDPMKPLDQWQTLEQICGGES